VYDKAENCPLPAFMQCWVKGEYSSLIISGKPSEFDLQVAFFNIFTEYIDLCGDADDIQRARLMNECAFLQARLIKIDLCLNYLTVFNEPEYVQYFRNMGFDFLRFPLIWENTDQWLQDIKNIRAQCNKFSLQLQMRKAELDSLEAVKKGEKPTIAYFDSFLIAMSNHVGYMLNPEKMTVQQFAMRKKHLIQASQKQIGYGRK